MAKIRGKKFYRYIRDFVDCDYLDTLNPEDRAWMEQFLLETYGCDSPKYGTKAILNRDQHLDALKDNARASKDLMSYRFRHDEPLEKLEETGEYERGIELLHDGNEHKLGGQPRKPRAPKPKTILIKKDQDAL